MANEAAKASFTVDANLENKAAKLRDKYPNNGLMWAGTFEEAIVVDVEEAVGKDSGKKYARAILITPSGQKHYASLSALYESAAGIRQQILQNCKFSKDLEGVGKTEDGRTIKITAELR